MLIFPLPYIIIKSAELAFKGNESPVPQMIFLNMQIADWGCPADRKGGHAAYRIDKERILHE